MLMDILLFYINVKLVSLFFVVAVAIRPSVCGSWILVTALRCLAATMTP